MITQHLMSTRHNFKRNFVGSEERSLTLVTLRICTLVWWGGGDLLRGPVMSVCPSGSPSGHAMGASAVWYVMVTALLAVAAERRCPPLLFK